MHIKNLLEHRENVMLLESFGLERDSYNLHWMREIHPLLMEVALSPEQVKQLFKSIETTAGEQGSNRTLAGKAVDAAGEVSEKVKDLWFNKLGSALQQSGPVQAFDAKYEEIKAKVASENPKMAEALGKYKQFADNNPKLQKFLLMIAASIAGALGLAVAGGAAAGIAATGLGVGAGVAIVNIVDRLLKGEKASTAIGRGATAGIVAGLTAAGVKAASEMFNSIANSFKPGQEYHEIMLGNPPRKVLINAEDGEMLAKLHQDAMSQMKGQDVADLLSSGGATPGLDKYLETAAEVAQRASDPAYQQAIADAAGAALDTTVGLDILQANAAEAAKTIAPIAGAVAGQKAGAAGEKKESYYVQTRPLSEGQVYLLLKKISEQQELTEGPMDLLKKGAGAVAGAVGKGLSAVGKQITTNATYPKLLAAWKLEGSPTDSEELRKFLTNYGGITPEVINTVYTQMKLPTAGAAGQTTISDAELDKLINQLNTKQKKEIMKYLQQQLGTA
jgi:hypothetical protein